MDCLVKLDNIDLVEAVLETDNRQEKCDRLTKARALAIAAAKGGCLTYLVRLVLSDPKSFRYEKNLPMPLHYAVVRGDSSIVRLLLSLPQSDEWGTGAAHCASFIEWFEQGL